MITLQYTKVFSEPANTPRYGPSTKASLPRLVTFLTCLAQTSDYEQRVAIYVVTLNREPRHNSNGVSGFSGNYIISTTVTLRTTGTSRLDTMPIEIEDIEHYLPAIL